VPTVTAPVEARIQADMVFFETAGGGAVFNVGSIAWPGSLSHNGYDNNVSRLTRNVLDRFIDPTPFEYLRG
jgi:N,N-dimethylformamidase